MRYIDTLGSTIVLPFNLVSPGRGRDSAPTYEISMKIRFVNPYRSNKYEMVVVISDSLVIFGFGRSIFVKLGWVVHDIDQEPLFSQEDYVPSMPISLAIWAVISSD